MAVDGKCPPLEIRMKPKGRVGLRKWPVLLAVGFVSFILLLSVAGAFTAEATRPNISRVGNAARQPNELIQALPGSYSDPILQVKKTGAAASAPVPPVRPIRQEGKVSSEELRLAKRALEARQSDISFKVLSGARSSRSERMGAQESEGPSLPGGTLGNTQERRREFLVKPRSGGGSLTNVREASSPYEVKAGSVIPGLLLTGINSDLPGPIVGQVSQNVYDSVTGRHLLIPQGTKAIGEYDSRVQFGEERVLVVWRRLIFPDGRSLDLEAMPGVDLAGYSGLKERVNNHYGKLVSGVALASVLGAGARVVQAPNRGEIGFAGFALQGAGQSVSQAGDEIVGKNLAVSPTLEISPGHRFSVFVTRDLNFEAVR